MRTKIFVMSMGLAASVWLTGCKSTSGTKHAAGNCGSNCASATCKSGECGKCAKDAVADGKRAEKSERTARLGGRLKSPPTSVPAAPCDTCAKCGGKCGADAVVAAGTPKTSEVTAASCSCAAKTGSAAPLGIPAESAAIAQANIPVVAATTLPPAPAAMAQQPIGQPIAAPPAPMAPGQEVVVGVVPQGSAIATIPGPNSTVRANYGPGVEVVGGQTAVLPSDSGAVAPGQPTVANNVMTIRFGQANNYGVVVGQVYQFRRAWKLRYTAVESDDRYGGSLTLIGDNLDHLKDGQMVRVEGAVLPSDDRASGARYQVNRVEVLEPDVK